MIDLKAEIEKIMNADWTFQGPRPFIESLCHRYRDEGIVELKEAADKMDRLFATVGA